MSRLPVHLILLGPPGAGKGTQAARLARRLGLAHISPGRILREAAAGESPVSREIRDRMAAGQLVDDQLVDRLVRERLEALSPGQGFILDGYPRTAAEARSLQETLVRLDRLRPPPLVVWFQASPDVLVRRLRDRARDEHRSDDSERVIGRRLEVHRDNARALRDALVGWTNVIEVDADQSPDAITSEIVRALRRAAPRLAGKRPNEASMVDRDRLPMPPTPRRRVELWRVLEAMRESRRARQSPPGPRPIQPLPPGQPSWNTSTASGRPAYRRTRAQRP